MKKLLLGFLITLFACNNEPLDSELKVPEGCDTTGIHVYMDSCKLANPKNPDICLTQEYLDEWCKYHAKK